MMNETERLALIAQGEKEVADYEERSRAAETTMHEYAAARQAARNELETAKSRLMQAEVDLAVANSRMGQVMRDAAMSRRRLLDLRQAPQEAEAQRQRMLSQSGLRSPWG